MSILACSSLVVCVVDGAIKLAQKSNEWSLAALVDEVPRRHCPPDRSAIAVADAILLGFDGVWDMAVCVVCFL